ncbi:putative ribonuclease H-like domain-containing protein [Tanacetum coccineum]
MLQRFNMPTQTIPMLSKKPKKATDDLHKDILGTRNPGLGYMAKRAQPVLYDADTFLHPAHHPVSIWDSEDVLVHQVKELSGEHQWMITPEFGWVRFLRTKDETPQKIEKFIVKTQRALNATVRFVRTDNGTEFVNKTLDGCKSEHGHLPDERENRASSNGELNDRFGSFDTLKEPFTWVCGIRRTPAFEHKIYADARLCQEFHDTQRSTSGSAQFLGHRLVSWSSKKQKSTAISTTEAEYIALSGCYAQILWMRSQLRDY